MTTKAETERTEAIEQLRKWLKPGDTVYTILRSVSRSGMQRKVGVVLLQSVPRNDENGEPEPLRLMDLHPNYSVAKALDRRSATGAWDAVICNGGSMDMGFELVYSLSQVLFNDGKALKQRWL